MLASVDILGKKYDLTIVERVEGDYGNCEYDACRIELASYQCEAQMRDTVLHEVMHGVEHTLNLRISEKNIRLMATGLLAVLRQNPALVAYLVE